MAPTKQSEDALKLANDIRLGRAQIKREIKAGECSVIDVLEACPFVCDTMTVFELFSLQPRWARHRTLNFLVKASIKEGRLLKELTSRQRKILIRCWYRLNIEPEVQHVQ